MWDEVLLFFVPFQNFSRVHCTLVSDSGPLGLLFSLHTCSSSCQLGKCTSKSLVIPFIAMKTPMLCNSLCLGSASIPVLFILAQKSTTLYIYFIDWYLKTRWSSGYGVGPPISRQVGWRWFRSWPGLYICKYFFLELKNFMSNLFFFSSGKIYRQMILRYFIGLFPFIDITFPIWVG